jgi:hypothetical protein
MLSNLKTNLLKFYLIDKNIDVSAISNAAEAWRIIFYR